MGRWRKISLLSVFCTTNRPLDLSHSFKKYKTTVPRCSPRQMSQGNIQISLNPGIGLGTRVYPDNLHFSDVHRNIFYIHNYVLPHRAIMLQYHIYHHLSSNSSLGNGNRVLVNIFCYYRSCKTLWPYVLLREHAHFATGISRVRYFKYGYMI